VNLAHGAAVDALRAHVRDASLGNVHNVQPCLPSTDTPENVAAAEKFAAYWNGAYPDPQLLGYYPPLLAETMAPYQQPGDLARICRPIDWFGLNHYSPLYVQATDSNPLGVGFGPMPPEIPRTAIGWPIEPAAFRDTLLDLHRRYRLPIYVAENGTANNDAIDPNGEVVDEPRIDYLKAYTTAMFEAIKEGADVRGYFVWSLLDNFEWGSGYSQRFGITYVDYPTQRRIPKASFRWYTGLIKASGRAPARSEPRVARSSR
jgi:beta-glucosidase